MTASSHRAESSRRIATILAVLLGVCAVMTVLHIAIGTVAVSPGEVLSAIFHRDDSNNASVYVWMVRGPRTAYCLVAGALLGLVGATFQALFRNPLADPYVVGVSSGAAVGGALGIALGFGTSWTGMFTGLGPVVLATLGGLGALTLVLTLSLRRGVLEMQSLLLTGVVLGSLLSSLLSLIMQWSGKDNQILSWLLGHMTPAYWNHFYPMAFVLGVSAPILVVNARRLNALAIGDDTARQLGVNTNRVRPLLLITGSIMVAVTVANVGIIGFLGLVSPHIARRLLGVDWRWSLIGSGLVGAALLCGADILAQRIVPDAEVPVGIVTAILGAPFLILLLRRTR